MGIGKNVSDYLKLETIELDLKGKNKNSIIKELYENLKMTKLIKDEEMGLKDVLAREEIGSTGIGRGVGLPHGKTEAVDEMIITIGISKNGIEYDAIDDQDVKIFFMFLCPKNATQEYLKVLARISRWIREENFTENILNAKSKEEIMEIIKKLEMTN